MNAQADRRQAVTRYKQDLILRAARAVFQREGLEGASLRLIAKEAGYTPAALYFHFESKEAIYAELLRQSLERLREEVAAAAEVPSAREQLKRAAMAFFHFYAENPRDLDLGFYLFRGGMKPAGLGRARDAELNHALAAALAPIKKAACDLGATKAEAQALVVKCFAHAAGLLLLLHTGRMRMFDASAEKLMESYLEQELQQLASSSDRLGAEDGA